jgi:hypothetical protein
MFTPDIYPKQYSPGTFFNLEEIMMTRYTLRFFRHILMYTSLALFTACGGGGGGGSSTPTTQQGQLMDAAVQGIGYSSASHSGRTDATGAFTYNQGEMVAFHIGGIDIGMTQGRKILTPVSLVSGAVDETNPTVINIVRFLLTIDNEPLNSDKIVITDEVYIAAQLMSINFMQLESDFENDPDVLAAVSTLTMATPTGPGLRSLVGSSTAQSHLNQTLRTLLSGNYSGSYGGANVGTWSVTVSTNGTITGNGHSNTDNVDFTISGSVNTAGSTSFSSTSGIAGTADFTGSINIATAMVSGNWTFSGGGGGSFTGSKQ